MYRQQRAKDKRDALRPAVQDSRRENPAGPLPEIRERQGKAEHRWAGPPIGAPVAGEERGFVDYMRKAEEHACDYATPAPLGAKETKWASERVVQPGLYYAAKEDLLGGTHEYHVEDDAACRARDAVACKRQEKARNRRSARQRLLPQ